MYLYHSLPLQTRRSQVVDLSYGTRVIYGKVGSRGRVGGMVRGSLLYGFSNGAWRGSLVGGIGVSRFGL